MELWETVILTLLIYHGIGFFITIIISLLHPGSEDDFCVLWGIGLILLPVRLLFAAIDAMKRLYRNKIGFAIVQKNPDNTGEYPRKICRYTDLPYFENSVHWTLVKRYPKHSDTKAGSVFMNKNNEAVILGYDLQYVTEKEIKEVKTEFNCFNCIHDGVECNEDECLCSSEPYMTLTEYPEFQLKNDCRLS